MTEFAQRKPFSFFAVLVAFNVVLLSIQIRNEQGSLLLRSWGLWVVTPVAASLDLVADGVSKVLQRYVLLFQAARQNRLLEAENARLKLELSQLRSLKSALDRARSYQFVEQQYLFETVLGGIIWKSAPFYAHRFLVNAGTRRGVRKDAAVLTPSGIVGRVWVTSPFSSEVELITNSSAAAGAMLADSRLQGVVQGEESGLLRWNYIPNYEEVEVGDIVYTSGTDQIYPKGLPIGHVVQSRKGPLVYRDILVEPFVDFARIEEVMVVVSRNDS